MSNDLSPLDIVRQLRKPTRNDEEIASILDIARNHLQKAGLINEEEEEEESLTFIDGVFQMMMNQEEFDSGEEYYQMDDEEDWLYDDEI